MSGRTGLSGRIPSSLASLAMVAAPTIMKFAERHPAPAAVQREDIATGDRAPRGGDSELDPTQQHCGVERWSIKVGSDGEARDVDLRHVQETTIEALRALQEPDDADIEARIQPIEDSVFVLRNVKLTHYKRESDNDYHIVLEDDHGNTVIAEIPESGCMPRRSKWRSQVRHARDAFDDQHDVNGRMKSATDTVSIVGVGFFDFIHGQKGVAPNGIELHPVLEICFGEDCKLELPPR